MRRGDIWFIDPDPARGTEPTKVRPAVIVSNNARNRAGTLDARTLAEVDDALLLHLGLD